MEKRKWIRPQLLVLTRGKPEEAVLTACKQGTWPGLPGDSNVNESTCIYNNVACAPDCATHGLS
jgi:hypothetical protein